MMGEHSPEGHLPVSFERSWDENPVHDSYYAAPVPKGQTPHVNYKEGVFLGYRYYTTYDKQPLFPFGFGLSYTTYEFSDLKASEHEVTFTVRNNGNRAGTEVAQVYAVLPASTGESTFKRLIAWDRVALAAGESKTVTLKLDPLYLSIFDVGKNKFVLAAGDYEILAGSSSHDTTLNTTVHIAD
jgi:beta-glucosidase